MNLKKHAWLLALAVCACSENGPVNVTTNNGELGAGPHISGPASGPVAQTVSASPAYAPSHSGGPTLSSSGNAPSLRPTPGRSFSFMSSQGPASHILWQNTTSGARGFWPMSGTTPTGEFVTLGLVPNAWRVAAIADMNNDGHEDLIWENSSTGVRGVWLMDGPDYIPSWLEIGQVGTDWHIAAVNDFTGDGKPDILWQSDAGVRGIWQMDGTMFTGNWFGLGQVDPAWDIADAADVTGDGRPDIIWQNLSNGSRGAWPMNGATPTGAFLGMGVVDGAWTIAAMGDFTGDNKPDLIWRNTSNGSTVIWAMNGVNYAGSSYSLGVVPPDWNLAGLLGANLCGMSTFLVDGSPGTGSLSNTDCQLNGRAADNYSFYLEQQTGARITLNASTIRYQMSIYHDYVSPSTFVGAWVLDNASTAETFQSILPAGYYVARVIAATAGETGSYNVTTTTFDENIGNCNGVFVTPVVATVQRLEATDCPTPANDGTRFDEFTQFMQAGHTYTVHAARNGGSLNVEIWRLDSMVSQNIDPSGNVSFSFTPTESGYYAIDVIANPGTGTIPYFLQIQ